MKNNNETKQFQRYGIRKFSQGVASVMIASGMFFLGGGAVSANEVTADQVNPKATEEVAVTDEADTAAEEGTTESATTTVTTPVETEKLSAAIDTLKVNIASAKETDSTRSALDNAKKALAEAEALLTDTTATQEQVDKALATVRSHNFVVSTMPQVGAEEKVATEGTNSIANTGSNDPRNGQSMGEAGDALRADTDATATDTTNNGTHIVTTEDNVPVDKETKDAIDKLKLGEGVGVLVDKTQTVTPDMQDPNGAKVEDPKSSMPNTTATSNADYHTFGYFGLHWLDFAGVDKQLPKDYYMRASSNKDDSKTDILLEMVKFSDQSVVESHTIDQTQQTDFTSLESVATGSLSKAYPIKALYDTTARDESKNIGGQVILYFAQIAGGWSMGSYNIPLNSAYVTKYVTDDGKLLATYSIKGSSKQMSTPSDVREFSGYTFKETQVSGSPKLNVYNIDAPAVDANNYQYKRLLEMVKADGTAVKSLWIVDPTLSAEEKAKVNFSDESTDGFIKVLETSPMEPGGVNENIKVITGQTLSDGTTLISEEEAAEIEKKAGDNDGVDFGTNNAVIIWQDPNNEKNYIRLGFVGNYGNVRPYGVTTPGKSAYMQTTWAPQTNYKLVPLENDALYVPTILHVYTKAGNVLVKYVDQDGNELSGTGLATVDATTVTTIAAGGQTAVEKTALTDTPLTYDTATETLKPQVIKTADGTIYYLVGLEQDKSSYDNNTPTDATDNVAAGETGTVQQGTTTITYQYKKAGSVSINYIATDGTVIKQPVTDVDNGKPGDAYNAAETDEKPATITTTDGKVYQLVTTAGTTTGGTTQLTYDANGVVTSTADGGNTVNNNPIGGQTGEVAAGKTTEVTYVYQEVKGSVVVKYKTTDGAQLTGELTLDGTDTAVDANGVAVTVDGKTEASNGADYETASYKPTIITTKDGKKYTLVTTEGTTADGTTYSADAVATGEGNDAVSGKIVAGATKAVTYIYQEAKGNVVVKYETTDGTVLDGNLTLNDDRDETTVPNTGRQVEDATDVSGGTKYDTTDYKPTTIETADGKVYKLVAQNNGLKDGSAPESGDDATVIAGETRTVTYLYEEVKGSVIVKYETTDGTQLSGDLKMDGADTATTVDADGVKVENATDVSGGTAYNTTSATYKPTTITTADGKVYKLVAQNNGLKDGSAPDSGDDATVIAGETRTVTYVYQEVKGDVIVKYIDDQGNELAGTATMPDNTTEAITTNGTKVADQVSLNQDYDTTAKKATRIVTADGKVYELASDVNNDKVVAKDSLKDGSADEKGQVAEDPQTVTYVYKEVKGSVKVNYVDAEGNPISGTTTGISKTTVLSTEADVDADGNALTDVSAGTEYNTTDLRPATITTADGTVYYYKEVQAGSAAENGKVEAGKTTEVTYVYEKAGSVVVNYVDVDGNPIAGTTEGISKTSVNSSEADVDADGKPVTNVAPGTKYDTTDLKAETIVTADGKTYAIVPEKTEGTETGTVQSGKTTEVTYVYREVKGDVVAEYYNEAGEKIATDKTVTPETSTGANYDATTEDYRPTSITTPNGDVYYYKEVKDDSEPTTGKVTEGTTTVKYVYEQAGNVKVHYVAEDGTVLKDPVNDVTNGKPGDGYNTTDNKPETITTADGKTYALVPEKTEGTETGTVQSGKTIDVTYVYREVKGDVVAEYYNEAGEKIAADKTVTPETSTGVDYDATTEDYRPTSITTPNGDVYYYKEVKNDSEPATGKVTEGTTTVKYVYEQAGNVKVHYVAEDGTVLKDPVNDVTNGKPGDGYNTTDNKPETITTADGKTYALVPEKTEGTETGTVQSGKTIDVTYVYREVTPEVKRGDVEVRYITHDKDGNVVALLEPETVVNAEEVGKGYNVENKRLETLTVDGKKYKLVEVIGNENGTIVEGTTSVTYVYVEDVEPTTNVTTSYVDENGTPIPGYPTVPGEQPKKDIPGYEFVRTDTDSKGNITHVYKKVTTPTPTPTEDKTTSYVDENGTPIPGYPTVPGEQPKKDIPGYEFVRTDTDPKGNITHVYKKVTTPTPTPTEDKTTSYVDENGTPIPGYPTAKGEQPKKDIPGYEFVRTDTDAKGNITHVYKKVTTPTPTEDKTTSYVDENGTPIPGYPTVPGEQPKKDIPGYEFVRTDTDAKGNITHVYKKVTTPTPTPTEDKTTSYVDEDGKEIPGYPTVPGEQPKKDIPGYEFVETRKDDKGNTIHVYKKVTDNPVNPDNKPDVKPDVKPEEPQQPETPVQPTTPAKQAELPNTGVSSNVGVFGAAAAAILSGLGIAIPGKKKKDDQ